MNTFLPYPDFARSANCLDRQRLGKQRVECLQILRTLLGLSKGWQNHPAARMWKGHERALGIYALIVCNTWTSQGYEDTCYDKIRSILPEDLFASKFIYPPWFGNEAFHSSHRASLLFKNFVWYSRFGWSEHPAINYVWPNVTR